MLKIKAGGTSKGRLVVQGFSQILGISITRDREKGAITISQKDYMDDSIRRYGIEDCNPAYNPGVGPKLYPEPTGEETVERGGEVELPGDYWSPVCI